MRHLYMLKLTFLLILPLYLTIDSPVQAANPFGNDTSSQEEFLPVEKAYQLHVDLRKNTLSLLWNITPGYYLYKDRFKLKAGDQNTGEPIELAAQFVESGKKKYDDYFEKELEVYYYSTEITAEIPAGINRFDLTVTSQGCADAGLCYPPHTQYFHIDVENGQAQPAQPPTAAASTSGGSATAVRTVVDSQPQAQFLPYILLLAALGGAILNLMPCVFPVLSIKAINLAEASQTPHHQHLHGWAYTCGVVASFLVVAAAMLAARSGGQAVGWGFQLQSPVFISFLAYLFFTMGLSFSGLIDFGTRLMGIGQSLTGGRGLRTSFFTGVLAAVVASPCTAPMMGTALGYAMTQPALTALSVFAALGFGMALPFLILSYTPHLARYLPPPGAWMEILKQFMAFPLYLAAIWLLWVLGHQLNSDAVILLSVGAVLISFALWLLRQRFSHSGARLARNFIAMTAVAGAAVIPFSPPTPNNDKHWEVYSADKLSQLRQSGEPVLVNLTADWCITCLANEKIALGTDKVNSAIAIAGIRTLKGDWTNYDPEITALLNRYGRSGVPLYLLFPAQKDAEAEILPQLLSEEIVLRAIERATPAQTALN